MCGFVSWVEKDQKVFFLTGDQLFRSERGRTVREQSGNPDDFTGHGIIRLFYGIKGGMDRECTDFSTPENFPVPIRLALVSGEMAGFPFPQGLLCPRLAGKYQADRKALDDKYQADLKALDDKYQADLKPLADKYWADLKPLADKYQADRKPLTDKYWADRKALDGKYQADRKALDGKYEADRKPLDDKYQADRKPLTDKYWADRKALTDKYWVLIKKAANRAKAWQSV